MKRVLSFILILSLFVNVLTVISSAASEETSGSLGENLSWSLDGSGVLTISGTGDMPDFVSADNQPWYSFNTKICSAIIAEGVTSVGAYAFSDCANMSNVIIADSVTSIGDYAFYMCELTDISISQYVTSIGKYALSFCTSLKEITVDTNNPCYSSENNVLFNKDRSVLIRYAANKTDSSYTIPEEVTSVGEYAFFGCSNLIKIDIPDGVASIGEYAFSYCLYLSDIIIPDSVISIGDSAFSRCESINNLILPEGTQTIGNSAFSACSSLTSIYIPQSVTSIGDSVFAACDDLLNITIDINNPYYSSKDNVLFNKAQSVLLCYAAGRTNRSYIVPESVVSIEDNAFVSCSNLSSIVLPNGVEFIGDYAFTACENLSGITIPGSVVSVGDYAFYDCIGLSNVIISDGVQTIGDHAFYACSSLSGINIPKSVTNIGNNAFELCSNLKNITVDSNNPCYLSKENVLFNKDMSVLIYYAAGITESNYDIPDGVNSIGDRAFAENVKLLSVSIPNSVTEIGEYAFYGVERIDFYGTENEWNNIILDEPNYPVLEAEINFKSPVTEISVNKNNEILLIDDTVLLTASVLPENYISDVVWKSSNENVAVVSNGSVQAVGVGSAVITAFVGGYEASCYITVSGEEGGEFNGFNWSFDGADTLYIKGNGFMKPVEYISAPWEKYSKDIKHLIIGSGITSIESYVFYWCPEIIDCTLPDTVTDLGNVYAYGDNLKLEAVNVDPGNKTFASVDGVVFSKDMTEIICVPTVRSGEFVIPKTVKTIGEGAFCDRSNITSVVIPDGVEKIGASAFAACEGLTSVTIPDSVIEIGEYAFNGCSSLSDISVGSGLRELGGQAFIQTEYYNNDENWDMDEYGKALYIDGCLVAFLSQGDTVNIKDGTRVIASGLFMFSGLDSMQLPDSVIAIGSRAFYCCESLKDISLPSQLVYIGDSAFDSSALTEIELPDSLEYIGERAFASANLTKVHIPASVTHLEGGCFTENNLSEFTVDENNASYVSEDNIIFSKDKKKIIYFPVAYSGEYTIPDTVEYIAPYAFYWCNQLTEVSVPGSTKEIGGWAFCKCMNLERINLSEGLETIGNTAFTQCLSLSEINIPQTVTEIGEVAFSNCTSLKSIVIPPRVTKIAVNLLAGCENLESISLPDGISYIDKAAFYDCASLKEINMPETVAYIGREAFARCGNLKNIDIPDSVTYLGEAAFHDCTALESVIFPVSIKYVNAPFSSCDNLKMILYTGTEDQFNDINCNLEDDLYCQQVIYNYDRGTYAKCSSMTMVNGTVEAKFDYVIKDGVAIVGVYDKKYNKLKEVKFAQINAGDKELELQMDEYGLGFNPSENRITLMLWDNLNTMNELGEPKSIE